MAEGSIETARVKFGPIFVGGRVEHFNGTFKVEKELGEGFTSTTFVARAEKSQRPELKPGSLVVIKAMKPNLPEAVRRRFFQEREVLTALNVAEEKRGSRCAPEYYSAETNGDHPYIIEEYIEAPPIPDLLAEKGFLAVEEVVEIGTRAVRLLDILHCDAHYTYKDMKPGNFRWDREAHVLRVIDWNVVEAHSEEGAAEDVFEAAAYLYEMATGKRLSRDGGQVLDRLDATNRWGELPYSLQAIFQRALHRDPQRRYRRAERLLGHLQDLSDLLLMDDETLRSQAEEFQTAGTARDIVRTLECLDILAHRQPDNHVLKQEVVNLKEELNRPIENALTRGQQFLAILNPTDEHLKNAMQAFAEVIAWRETLVDPPTLKAAYRGQETARLAQADKVGYNKAKWALARASEALRAERYDEVVNLLQTVEEFSQAVAPILAEARFYQEVGGAVLAASQGKYREASGRLYQAKTELQDVFAPIKELLEREYRDIGQKAQEYEKLADTRERSADFLGEAEKKIQSLRYGDALADLERAIVADPGSPKILATCQKIGLEQMRQGGFHHALALFEMGRRVDPQNPDLLLLGRVARLYHEIKKLRALGRQDDASTLLAQIPDSLPGLDAKIPI